MKLLHVDSSALGSHSVSRQLSAEVVTQLQRLHPGIEVRYHDLAAQPLPHWTPVADAADPATARGGEMLDEFLAADIVVIGAPMYNFSIPSQLKAWLDRIAVAGKTFRYGPNGPEGLAGGKRVIVASSRGGMHANSPMDFQEPYLRALLGFLGIDQVEFVRAEGVNMGAEHKAGALASARQAIGALGALAQAA